MTGLPQALKTRALCDLLDISDDTLRRAKDRGELNPFLIGSDFHWPVDEVRLWLERRRCHAGHGATVTPLRAQNPGFPTGRRL